SGGSRVVWTAVLVGVPVLRKETGAECYKRVSERAFPISLFRLFARRLGRVPSRAGTDLFRSGPDSCRRIRVGCKIDSCKVVVLSPRYSCEPAGSGSRSWRRDSGDAPCQGVGRLRTCSLSF